MSWVCATHVDEWVAPAEVFTWDKVHWIPYAGFPILFLNPANQQACILTDTKVFGVDLQFGTELYNRSLTNEHNLDFLRSSVSVVRNVLARTVPVDDLFTIIFEDLDTGRVRHCLSNQPFPNVRFVGDGSVVISYLNEGEFQCYRIRDGEFIRMNLPEPCRSKSYTLLRHDDKGDIFAMRSHSSVSFVSADSANLGLRHLAEFPIPQTLSIEVAACSIGDTYRFCIYECSSRILRIVDSNGERKLRLSEEPRAAFKFSPNGNRLLMCGITYWEVIDVITMMLLHRSSAFEVFAHRWCSDDEVVWVHPLGRLITTKIRDEPMEGSTFCKVNLPGHDSHLGEVRGTPVSFRFSRLGQWMVGTTSGGWVVLYNRARERVGVWKSFSMHAIPYKPVDADVFETLVGIPKPWVVIASERAVYILSDEGFPIYEWKSPNELTILEVCAGSFVGQPPSVFVSLSDNSVLEFDSATGRTARNYRFDGRVFLKQVAEGVLMASMDGRAVILLDDGSEDGWNLPAWDADGSLFKHMINGIRGNRARIPGEALILFPNHPFLPDKHFGFKAVSEHPLFIRRHSLLNGECVIADQADGSRVVRVSRALGISEFKILP